jgi:hypothetical protein
MARHRQSSPARHDPARIRRLLAEREKSGESYGSLSRRSGIPIGTLASWMHRERQRDPGRSAAFVELRVRKDDGDAEIVPCPTPDAFTVVVSAVGRRREILVPPGFDADELRAVIAVLEEPPC